MKMISEGAEAKIYEIDLFGAKAIMKRREEKKYRVKELDQKLRKERTKAEARIMARLLHVLNVPKIAGAGQFSIIMEKLEGRLLKDMRITPLQISEAGRILGKMHEMNIAHGDFTPANLMSCKNGLYVIDFGLSEMTNSFEEKALDMLLMKRSIPKDLYLIFERSYSKSFSEHAVVLERLKEIEKRGRYQIRTLA